MSRLLGADLRCKDVIFALSVAGKHSQPLGRLALQKLIYLFDVLAISWRHVGARQGFHPWHNGPYDRNIQNAVDLLAFRGFVGVSELSFRHARNVGCRYLLTDAGSLAVTTLCDDESLANDLELFAEIALEVDRRGWRKLREIVYAEPTYIGAVAAGAANPLPLGSAAQNLSWVLLKQIRDASSFGFRSSMSRKTLVQVFFAMLDEHREGVGAQIFEDLK